MIAGTLEIQMLANMARLADDMNKATGMVGGAMKNIEQSVDVAKKALGALGIGLSVGYFAHLIKGSIDAADKLGDLSKASNMSVQDMAGLSLLAKQNGTDLDGLAKSIQKMSVEMGKDPQKFKALGITATSNKEAFMQFADIFAKLPDINQRNALSAAVFGKSWAEIAAVMSLGGKEIGKTIDKGAELSGITKEMVEAADAFNDKLAELAGTGGLLTRMVGPLLPILNAIADDLIQMQKSTVGSADAFNPLAEAFRAIIILGGNFAYVVKAIGNDLGGMAAQMAALASGDFKGFSDIHKQMIKDAEDGRKAFDEWEKKMLEVGKVAKEAPAAAPGVDKSEAANAKARAQAFLDAEKIAAALKKSREDALKSIQAYMKAIGDETAALIDKAHAAKQENELIGKTAAEITIIEAARYDSAIAAKAEQAAQMEGIPGREAELFLIGEQIKSLKLLKAAREQKGALTALAEANESAAKKAAQEWERFTENVQRNLGDVLYDSMNGTFTNIGDLFNKMLMRMAADAAAAQITKSLFGGAGSGTGGGGAGANGAAAGDAASGAAAGAAIGKAMPYIAAAYLIAKVGFGMGNERENVGGSRLVGQFDRAGFAGRREQSFKRDSGLIGGTSYGTEYSRVDSAEQRALKATVDGLQKTFDILGDTIGYTATRTKSWTINVNQAGDVTGLLADGMGEQLVPSLILLRDAGENLAQTANRVTTAFQSTSYFISALGLSSIDAFGSLGIASAAARLKLIEAAGGLETFNRTASFFVSNFLTETQKLAPSLAMVGRTFAQLGITGISTNKEFAERVALETQLGNFDTVAKLLSVSEAFNAITASAKLAADQLKEINFKSMVDFKRAQAYGRSGGAAGQIADATSRAAAGLPAEEEANRRQARIDAKKNAYNMMVEALAVLRAASLPFHFVQQPDGTWLEEREMLYKQKKALYESLPAFANGSAYIPRDMTANIHQGEMVVDAQSANVLRKYGMSSGNDALVSEIRALRAEVAALRAPAEDTARSSRKTSDLLRNVTRDGNSVLTSAAA